MKKLHVTVSLDDSDMTTKHQQFIQAYIYWVITEDITKCNDPVIFVTKRRRNGSPFDESISTCANQKNACAAFGTSLQLDVLLIRVHRSKEKRERESVKKVLARAFDTHAGKNQ